MAQGMFTRLNGFLTRRTRHPIPKVATLIATSALLVVMINLDAAATPATRFAAGVHTGTFTSIQPGGPFAAFGPYHYNRGAAATTTTGVATPGGVAAVAPIATPTLAGPTSTAASGDAPTPSNSTPPPTTTTTAPPTTTTSAPPTTTTTTAPPTTTTTTAPPTTTTTSAPAAPATPYPIGTLDASAPSGYAPPAANAMAGYTQSYVTDFNGSSLPSGWYTYSGQPGGDPGSQWASSHVSVSGGILTLNAFQDPAYGGEWVTGGLCQCGVARTYGAYFVRSRVTGAGPTQVELLWPANNTWPPEIDFSETSGGTGGSTASDIWASSGSSRSQVQSHVSIDMTAWHTWGVIWTPTTITYTVDGRVWGEVANSGSIPSIPMTLDIQQQTWCSSGYACPSAPQSMQVNWVAEYAPGA